MSSALVRNTHEMGSGMWEQRAACRGSRGELFYPPVLGEARDERRRREMKAKAICGRCEVQRHCLDFARARRRAPRHLGRSHRARARRPARGPLGLAGGPAGPSTGRGGRTTLRRPWTTATRQRMPSWVPRAIVLFWFGFVLVVAAGGGCSVGSQTLLVMLLVSLFLSLALEPAVNKLGRAGLAARLGHRAGAARSRRSPPSRSSR